MRKLVGCSGELQWLRDRFAQEWASRVATPEGLLENTRPVCKASPKR